MRPLTRILIVAVVLIGTIVPGGALMAQLRAKQYAGGVLAATRLDTEVVPDIGTQTRERFTGAVLGFEGGVPFWKLEASLRYLEGTLSSDVSNVDLDVVEAELLLGVRPISWVVLKFGPHGRSFHTQAGGTERWLFWEVRARAEAGLLAPQLNTYLEIWGALAGTVNFGRSFGGGRGAEAGMSYQLPSVPLWGRIGYRVDRGSLEGGARFDSVQEVIFAVGYGAR